MPLLIYHKPAEFFHVSVDWSWFLYLASFVHSSEKPIHFLIRGFNSAIRTSDWSEVVFSLAIRWGDQADWCEGLPSFPVAHLHHLRGLLRCRLPLYWTGTVSAVSLSTHSQLDILLIDWLLFFFKSLLWQICVNRCITDNAIQFICLFWGSCIIVKRDGATKCII